MRAAGAPLCAHRFVHAAGCGLLLATASFAFCNSSATDPMLRSTSKDDSWGAGPSEIDPKCVHDTGLSPAEVKDMAVAWSENMEAVQKYVIGQVRSMRLMWPSRPRIVPNGRSHGQLGDPVPNLRPALP